MADDQDPEQKTEQPSQKRLEEAHQKGNIPISRELASLLLFAVLAFTIAWAGPGIFHNTGVLLLPFIANIHTIAVDPHGVGISLYKAGFGGLWIIAVPLVACMAVSIAASILQHGFIFSVDPVTPKLERVSPLAGFKRMFSMRSVVEFLKSIIKIVVVGVVAWIAVYPELNHLRQLPNSTAESMLYYLSKLSVRMLVGIIIAMFFIAIFDVLYQRFEHMKSLRMSRQDLRDEHKQSEGDPMVKQRLRQLRMERARKRMMAAVPDADVVITNPTHFAVALKYDNAVMNAPTVVAKGQDNIALKIREIAKENNVTIVENPPLAQALFKSTDIDEEIPAAHYEAVAKIISYVYRLKGKKMPERTLSL